MDEFRSKLIVKKSIKKVLKCKAATDHNKHKYDVVLALNRNLTRWHFNQQLKKYD
jgi:hypothetical protein